MSQHHVEDLVEDSVRLIRASNMPVADQRRLIRDLFAFQALFDTSDTLGRVAAELQAIGYFEDKTEPAPLALLAMIAAVMREADRKDDLRLAHHWLAMLIEGLDEGDLEDEVPRTFAGIADDAGATAIREIAIRNDLARKRPKHGYIALKSWAGVKPFQPPSAPAEIERSAILRYFADLKAAPSAIEAGRRKLLDLSASRSQSPFHRLPELGALPEGLSLVRKAEDSDRTTFLFALAQASPEDESRIYFKIEQNSDLNIIVGEFWIVSETLLRWQKPGGSPEGAPVHFTSNFFSLVPEEQAQSGTAIHPMGGWKYRLNQSQKLLIERLAGMVSFWPRSAPLLAFNRQSLVQRLLDKGLDQTLAERGETADKLGFFRTEIEVMFAFACLGLERGEDIAPIIDRIEKAFGRLSPHSQKRAIWQEGVARLKAGTIWFPSEMAGIFSSYRV